MMGTSNKYTTSAGLPSTTQFNPGSPYYKTCCCHVRKFTVTTAIIEIFIVCFMLVAVIPDLSSKICENEKSPSRLYSTVSKKPSSNYTAAQNATIESYLDFLNGTFSATEPPDNSSWYNHSGTNNPPFVLLRQISCNYNVIWLILAVIQVLSANLMFYSIKSQFWFFFFPHIFGRFCCIIIVIFLCTLLMIGAVKGPISSSMFSTAWVTTIFGLLFCIFYIYVLICEIKCCQFVKKSKETGISYSSTRPVAPPTMSGSETRPPNSSNANNPPHPPGYNQTSIPMATFSNQRPNPSAGGRGGQSQATRRGSGTFDILPPLRHGYGVSGVGR